MNIKKSKFIIIIILSIMVGAGGTLGTLKIVANTPMGDVSVSKEEYDRLRYMDQKYEKAETLWQNITDDFYKDVDEEKLEVGMYRGIFEGLDDKYSGYMTKDEYAAWEASVTGSFEGIGITFSEDDTGHFVVLSTVENSPAAKAGIKAGDIITKVDGKTFKNAETIGAAMRGKAGTEVKITYVREKKEHTVSITRGKIVTETIKTKMLENNIGYIKITSFEQATGDDFIEALSEMEKKSPKGIIIDLRDNGGGIVDSGVTVADALMGKGTITYLEDRSGKKEYFKSDEDRTDVPYVILVNENTASTSEIVSAAVKDNGPGKIVGTTTFGKGVVQSIPTLADGSAYKLTIMQYFSPKGKVINGKGVEPDYPVEGADAQLKKAIELLK